MQPRKSPRHLKPQARSPASRHSRMTPASHREPTRRAGRRHGGFKDVLKNKGFVAFLWTQFFGAFNDNVYRAIVALRALHEQGGKYASLVVGVFVIPGLLFSGYAGHLADVVSKRSVLIGVKI